MFFSKNLRSWKASRNLDKTGIHFILLLLHFTYFLPPMLLTDLSLTRQDAVGPPGVMVPGFDRDLMPRAGMELCFNLKILISWDH